MANSIAKLAILLTADASGLIAPFQKAEDAVKKLEQRGRDLINGMMNIGAAGAAGFVGWGVKLAADAEQAAVAFRVLMGDGEKAKKLLGEIRQFALETPFGEAGLRQGAQTLMQFGVAGENVMPVMKMLGDVSLGNSEKFDRLAVAFGQMASAGRLTGQDLLQMINSGFNPLQEISRTTGESMADLKKRMEEGGISTQEVVKAFQSATGEGGRFNNMMEAMADTTTARWAKLVESTGQLAMKLGTQLLPALNTIMAALSGLVDWLGSIDRRTVVWVASIAGAIYLVPKIVAGIRAIISAFRAMATAQAIQQALAGPAGWATLAAGLALAAGSAIAVNAAFDSANKTIAKTSQEAKKAADATSKLNLELFTGAAAKKDTAAEDAAKAAAKRLEDLRRQGEQLAQSLRTPFEKIADDLSHAKDLLDAGVISAETYARAMSKAREDLAGQLRSAQEIRDSLRQQNAPVAALQYGTQAAFSAIAAQQREQKVQQESARQMIQRQDIANTLLKKILDKKQEPVRVNEVTL